MTITLTLQELKDIIENASKCAVATLTQEQRPAADLISQHEAFIQFKEARVRRWVELGMIRSERVGESKNSKKVFSRKELLTLDAAERMKPIINRRRRV